MKVLLVIALLFTGGLGTPEGMSVKDVPADVPEFQRIYTAKIARGIQIKLTIRTFIGDIMRDGEMTQPDGRYILFEPERPADKIIDPVLEPQVEKFCRQVIAIDQAWRNSHPAEFVDENGTHWRKVKP